LEQYLTEAEFNLFSSLIYVQSGIHFSETNRVILESRLKERIKVFGKITVKEYYDHILTDQDEMKLLLDSVTTNLTKFFRNTGHFLALEHYVIKELLEHKSRAKDTVFRVWSAGCSTGEEPFSIAMVLKDKLPPQMKIEITGSDISLKSLLIAKAGFYPIAKIGDVPESYRHKYFEKKRDGYQIHDEIRDLVRFDYHNLKNDSGQRNLDIVMCRNVIIYFDAEAQKATINRLWKSMTDYSFLFIGHSESLFGMNTGFEFVKTEWTTLYRKLVKQGRLD
jgi:chemotaxis protein methyltransferase CheR